VIFEGVEGGSSPEADPEADLIFVIKADFFDERSSTAEEAEEEAAEAEEEEASAVFLVMGSSIAKLSGFLRDERFGSDSVSLGGEGGGISEGGSSRILKSGSLGSKRDVGRFFAIVSRGGEDASEGLS